MQLQNKSLPKESLQKEVVPFSVKVPFVVATDMYKLGNTLLEQPEEKLLCFDERYPDYVIAKLALLKVYPEHSRCYLTDSLDDVKQCLWELTRTLTEDQPDYIYSTINDGVQGFCSKLLGISLYKNGELKFDPNVSIFPELAKECFEHLQALSDFEKLCDLLSFSVQEDLIMMHKTGEGATEDRAECMLACLPTHWDPKEKVGLDFGAIHKPIAHSDSFNKSQGNLMKAMTYKGPFVRYNWTLSSMDELSLNPAVMGKHSLQKDDLSKITDPEQLIDKLYFRPERQTLIPFPHLHRSIFAIHVFHEPLRNVLKTDQRKREFKEAVASMSPEVLRYRGMTGFVDMLLKAF